ncbi:MAG: hypothetical protein ACK4QL_04505 [Pseudanabaenaceae cyanobacterium]
MRLLLVLGASLFGFAVSVSAETFQVVGTEPFWGVQLNPRRIILERMGMGKRTFPHVPPIQAAGKPLDLVRVYNWATAIL